MVETGAILMSKMTNIALLIWMIAIYIRDFLFGDTPSKKCANLLIFSGFSSLLSSFKINTNKMIMIIIAIHVNSRINANNKETILLAPEMLKR